MIIGTAGHIDHGKTSLVRRLTGVETDRLKEEKARGISIALGFAYWPQVDGSVVGFIDVPGHEKFVHTMLAGAAGIDLLLLVVAADDGVMPQTREHVAIARLLGINEAVVAITKADLVEADRIEAVENEVAALLASGPFARAPMLPVSTLTGEGLPALADRLAARAREAQARQGNGAFRLAVDRCFTLQGAGTVVTGTVLSGSVTVGDRIVVSPGGLPARVRSIHAQNRPAERGVAGERCALNLAGPGVTKDAIRHGEMVLAPALHAPTPRIDAEVSRLPGEKALTMWQPVRLHHAAAEIGARIVLLNEGIDPGGDGLIQLVLDEPIAAATLDRFVLRDTGASRTIGGGRFLDLRAPERRRRSPERLAQLAALRLSDPAEALHGLLSAPPHHADINGFARDRALAPEAADNLTNQLDLVRIGPLAMLPAHWQALAQAATARLDAFHAEHPDLPGMGLERLRFAVAPRWPAPLFRQALARLTQDGVLVPAGSWLRRPGYEARLSPDDEALWERIMPLVADDERFRPPRVRDIAQMLGRPEEEIRRLLRLSGRRGDVHEVALDHFFLRGTLAEMVGIAAELAEAHPAGFNAAQFRDRLDNGRKVAIQILEFFDRHGVTIRRGDLRRINRRRLDLFGPLPGSSDGGETSPVGRPDFKSGRGRQTVSGGFDSHSLPPVP
ncbi:MAG: selenocysteine-specific translation elongation factor [Hyphomicrobiales bacterium]|nr:MAG: selenocysteine-specific translation elongation factor [Hyphomicrobiales bacterium]